MISVLVCGVFFTAASAQEKPSFDGSITPTSQYIWRGYEFSKDSLVFFLDGVVSYKGFAAEIWVDLDTDYKGTKSGYNRDKQGNIELWETDLVLSYSNSINELNYSFGWIYYDYNNLNDENQEIYLSFGYDTFLSPTISLYREIEVGEAYYAALDFSHSFPLENGWLFDLGGKVSYMYDEDGDIDGSGSTYNAFHDCVIWTGLTIPYGEYWTISPTINYSFPLESDSEDFMEFYSYDGNDSNFFWGSIQFSVSF